MRCPSCEKFVGLDMADPEPEEPSLDEEGTVTITVRIVRTCSDCGDELKGATLEMEGGPEDPGVLKAHKGEGHALEVDGDPECEPIEEGGGRYAKSYYGASVSVGVRCSCQEKDADPLYTVEMSDKTPASYMDELV